MMKSIQNNLARYAGLITIILMALTVVTLQVRSIFL